VKSLLLAVWNYRYFILSTIRNDFKAQFARSKFGGLWMIINPLAQVAIYALILSNILAAKLPGITDKYGYAIYLMAGLLAWTLFNDIVTRCLNLFIAQGNLMKKMQFPRIALPCIVLGSCLFSNLLLFVSMLVIFALLGHQFSMAMLWLMPLSLIIAMLAMGVGLILGVMNVFMRDIGLVVPIILQMLFWFTPIVYPVTIIPESYRHYLELNPMFALTSGYQQLLVYNATPSFEGIIIVAGIALLLIVISLFLFRRASAEMMDVL